MVDARDLKSLGRSLPCRFDSGPRHQISLEIFNSLEPTIILKPPRLCPFCARARDLREGKRGKGLPVLSVFSFPPRDSWRLPFSRRLPQGPCHLRYCTVRKCSPSYGLKSSLQPFAEGARVAPFQLYMIAIAMLLSMAVKRYFKGKSFFPQAGNQGTPFDCAGISHRH